LEIPKSSRFKSRASSVCTVIDFVGGSTGSGILTLTLAKDSVSRLGIFLLLVVVL